MNDFLVLDTSDQITMARYLSLRGMLRLECQGMKRSHPPSAYSIIKSEFHFKGNKARVLEQFEDIIKQMSANRESKILNGC